MAHQDFDWPRFFKAKKEAFLLEQGMEIADKVASKNRPLHPWEKQLPGEKWISLGLLLLMAGLVYGSTYSPGAVEFRNQHWCDTRECVTDYRLNQP